MRVRNILSSPCQRQRMAALLLAYPFGESVMKMLNQFVILHFSTVRLKRGIVREWVRPVKMLNQFVILHFSTVCV